MKKIIMLMSFLMGACFIAPIYTAQEVEIEQFDGGDENNIESARLEAIKYVEKLQERSRQVPYFLYNWEIKEYIRRLRDREFDDLQEIQNIRRWAKEVFDRGVPFFDREEEE